jgi:hypothetical protein
MVMDNPRLNPTLGGPSTWALPLRYEEMSPQEQASAVRSSILRFIDEVGRARAGDICDALGLPRKSESWRKQLRYLCATQQLYSDNVGRDPTYYRNGRLAHPLLQSNFEAGTRAYSVRTYSDSMTGRYVTITEYAVSPLGEKTPKSGIRIDVVDLERFYQELSRIITTIMRDNTVLEPGLIR